VFFALIGGLILNLMPCVFPVLSLKALAIAKHSEMSRTTIRKEGIAYTIGVLTCFWGLAVLLILLQQAGASIGWGFQFQSPAFVALMALLMLFIGLNLSGIYELPVLFGNVATQLEKPDSLKGSYFTGLLAALVATPCTAPFMATAAGALAGTVVAGDVAVGFHVMLLRLALPPVLTGFGFRKPRRLLLPAAPRWRVHPTRAADRPLPV
jgi:thiol:disulfide interchange protein DsbD